jgi:hypothetical protein
MAFTTHHHRGEVLSCDNVRMEMTETTSGRRQDFKRMWWDLHHRSTLAPTHAEHKRDNSDFQQPVPRWKPCLMSHGDDKHVLVLNLVNPASYPHGDPSKSGQQSMIRRQSRLMQQINLLYEFSHGDSDPTGSDVTPFPRL